MIRPTARFASVIALAVVSLPISNAVAQQQVPAAPAPEVSAPAPTAAITLPKPNPSDFTAASPTKELVTTFLQLAWGYDDSKIWQVQGILKTPAEGTSKVFVVVADKSGKVKPTVLHFYVLPDGKHVLAGDEIIPFGDHPYTEYRAMLQQRADGPYRGSPAKDLELVEFADFQCPHCKEAQANMDKLVSDFPKARIVFQNYPLGNAGWKGSKPAAAYGVCVAKQGGSNAFFQYASTVFEGQEGLSSDDGVTLTLNSAVAKAGLDPTQIAACAALPVTKAAVEASVKLGKDVGVLETPTLIVNGRQVPLGGVAYDTIKQIVLYQMKLDGLTQ